MTSSFEGWVHSSRVMELCDRIYHWVSKQPPSVHHSLCVSTFDFESLYTNITWENLLLTWEWWKKWCRTYSVCVTVLPVS